MKLTIWQQFSSNNSSSYVIVGLFKSNQETHEASIKFKTFLKKLWTWYMEHPEIREAVLNEEGHELTDSERAMMAEYNIEFTEAIEWVARETAEDFLEDAVISFENYLFVATVDETVTDDKPLAQYMHQLGADVVFEEKMQSYIMVEISAKAPDDITANFIKSSVDKYLMRDDNIVWQRPPWVLFFDGMLAENLEELSSNIDLFIANYHAWRNWHTENKERFMELVRQRDDAWRARDSDLGQKFQKELSEFSAGQHKVEPKIDEVLKRKMHRIMSGSTPMSIGDVEGVSISDNTVKFPAIDFLPDNLGHGISTIVTWLRAMGCVDVQYKFVVLPAY
jgi:hypothetical protein